ncbi:MAG: hypothetical protein ACOWWH_06795 [Eubacteriaceae bacterium]
MKDFNKKGSSTLVFTIIVMLFLCIIIVSILYTSLLEYKSTINYARYEQALYLAQGAGEEAISILTSNWNNNVSTSWSTMGNGYYKYSIFEINETRKKIIAEGKVKNIYRKFELIVEIAPKFLNLSSLSNYAIYCDGDLTIMNIEKISSKDEILPTVVVTGNMNVNSMHGGGAYLDVKGNIKINNCNKEVYFNNYIEKDTLSPNYSKIKIDSYKNWLINEYPDLFYELLGDCEDSIIIDNNTNPTNIDIYDICYVQGINKITVNKCTMKGVLILSDIKEIYIDNNTIIEGVLLIIGKNNSVIKIDGKIEGCIIILDASNITEFYGQLIYNKDIIQNTIFFLPDGIIENNCTHYVVNVLKCKEIK